MKRKLFAAILAALSLIFLGACATPDARLGGAGGKKVLFRLNLKKGASYSIKYAMEQDVSQTLMGMTQSIKQSMTTACLYEVSDERAGVYAMKITYTALAFRQDGPLGVIEFDSAKPNADSMLSGLFSAFVGQAFTMKIDREGRVSDVQGLNAMQQRALDKTSLPNAAVKQSMKKLLTEQFGEQAFTEMAGNFAGMYPDGPVGVGDSWKRTYTVTSMFPMTVDASYALKSRAKGKSTIDVRSTVKPNAGGAPIDLGIIKINYEISGDQSGTLLMDEKSGLVTDMVMTQNFTGTVRPEGPLLNHPWPISMKNTIHMTMEKR